MCKFRKSGFIVVLLGIAVLAAECPAGADPLGVLAAACWKFDETEGQVAKDSSGNKNNAAVYGAVPKEGNFAC